MKWNAFKTRASSLHRLGKPESAAVYLRFSCLKGAETGDPVTFEASLVLTGNSVDLFTEGEHFFGICRDFAVVCAVKRNAKPGYFMQFIQYSNYFSLVHNPSQFVKTIKICSILQNIILFSLEFVNKIEYN